LADEHFYTPSRGNSNPNRPITQIIRNCELRSFCAGEGKKKRRISGAPADPPYHI
jgi:hypothetical protein